MKYTVIESHIGLIRCIGSEDEAREYLKPLYPGVAKINLAMEFRHHWVREWERGDRVVSRRPGWQERWTTSEKDEVETVDSLRRVG